MSLKAKIESINGDRVVVVFEDGQKLTVSTGEVEGMAKVGQDVILVMAALGGEDAGRAAIAKNLLNELLRPSNAA